VVENERDHRVTVVRMKATAKQGERGMAGEAGSTLTVTDDTFTQAIEKAGGVAMVDFWATWCAPCRIIAPSVEELAKEYADKGVLVGKVDVDHNPGIAARFGIRSIPSVLYFKDGKHVDTVVGAVPKSHLEKKLREHL
jgi:thioredoxin 1